MDVKRPMTNADKLNAVLVWYHDRYLMPTVVLVAVAALAALFWKLVS